MLLPLPLLLLLTMTMAMVLLLLLLLMGMICLVNHLVSIDHSFLEPKHILNAP
jgi:Na+-transporting methylmalonyl-CoA/oxaloacetate decarboxylase gamma subunit